MPDRVVLHSYHQITHDDDGKLYTKYWAPKWQNGNVWHEWEMVPPGKGTQAPYREQTLWKRIIGAIKSKPWCSNKEIYQMIPDKNPITIRGRLAEMRKAGVIETFWGDEVRTDIRPQGGWAIFNIAYHSLTNGQT